jgi:hypothetical protein
MQEATGLSDYLLGGFELPDLLVKTPGKSAKQPAFLERIGL